MKEILLDYGDGKMPVDLPDTTMVVKYGETYTDPPEVDPIEATRKALAKPLGFPPLSELGGPEKKVVIAFPDRVKGGAHTRAHRKISIPIIIEALQKKGTKLENIWLLCAMGLHRKNTLEDWLWYLGKDIVDQFWPDRLVNHDANSPDLCDYGKDDLGDVVECNRLIAEADLPILIGHCTGNPYGGYSGGYKMVATGISGMRSIACHHSSETMHRDDWLGASPKSYMRQQFDSIGKAIENGMGKKFFAIDAVLGQKSQILGVCAGDLDEVQKETWPLADKRTNITLDMTAPADILIFGLPRNFHYGPGMGSNPILMSLAIAGQLSRAWRAFREGGVIIAPAVCDGWFNELWFPSYEETYDALQSYCEPSDFLNSSKAEEIATNPDYCYRYSYAYAYHPFHAMSMISGGAVTSQRTTAVFMPGAKVPKFARGLGYIPTNTFEDAMERAIKIVGKNPRILCTPEAFSGGVGVHIGIKGFW